MAGELARTTKPSAARPSGIITGYERMHLGRAGRPRGRALLAVGGFICRSTTDLNIDLLAQLNLHESLGIGGRSLT
jgi:hypothetical protein